MKGFLAASSILALSLCAQSLEAGFDFRCNGALVTPRETKPEVIAECGPPTFVERLQNVFVHVGPLLMPLAVDEEWIYNLGPQQFIRYVRFRDGRVVDIDHGGYGWTETGPPSDR